MAIEKKTLISYIVGGVGATAGIVGLAIGLTKKPEVIVTGGYTLHVKYLNDPTAKDDIATYEHMTTVPTNTVNTIANLTFDDPKDKDHHTKALDKIYADTTQTVTIYEPGKPYQEVTLSEDTTWYIALKQSHYHVYLHYWDSKQVYNPNDYYPTKEYDPGTGGFSQRSEPTSVTNYEFLGWQLNTEEEATATTKGECLYSVGETPRPDNNGNEWPVIPDRMKIAGKDVGAREWHLHPIYKLINTTFNFFDTNGTDKIMDSVTESSTAHTRDIGEPSKEHYKFSHWTYMDETKLIVNQQEVTRKKDDPVQDGDFNCEFLCPTVPLKAHWEQNQHKATFYLNDAYTKKEEVWVDITDGETAYITEDDLPVAVPLSSNKEYKFVGWSEKENPTSRKDIIPSWPLAITNDDKKIYPVFVKADFTITVNYVYDGITGVWKKDGEEPVTPEGTSTFGVWKDISYTVLDLTNEARISLGLDDGYQLYGKDTKPNFLGWKLEGHSELIQTTIKFTTSTIINAVYGDSNNITVTFNSSGGDFTYKDRYNETITNSIISYNLKLDEWRAAHDGHVYLHDVYEATLASTEERGQIVLTRDGFELDDSLYNPSQPDSKSGWASYNINLPHNFEINESLALEAKWERKKPATWADDDWGTIAYYADQGYDALLGAYGGAYASTSNVGDTSETAPKNKAKNTFVGLQKEISIPTLGDTTYTVRVIGVNQDQIYSATNKALLTFDFVDCPISAAVGKNNDYVNGYINQTYSGLIKGGMTYTMRNSIKPVVKPQILDNGTSTYSVQTFNNYIFIESAYEINGGTDETTGGSSTKVKDSSAYVESIAGTAGSDYKKNLIKYQWYDKEYEDPNKDAANPDSLTSRNYLDKGSVVTSAGGVRTPGTTSYRCKYIGNTGVVTPWQLRTPGLTDYYNPEQTSNRQGNSFYVTSDESIDSEGHETYKPAFGGIWDYYSNIANYISPCFCLGIGSVAP